MDGGEGREGGEGSVCVCDGECFGGYVLVGMFDNRFVVEEDDDDEADDDDDDGADDDDNDDNDDEDDDDGSYSTLRPQRDSLGKGGSRL